MQGVGSIYFYEEELGSIIALSKEKTGDILVGYRILNMRHKFIVHPIPHEDTNSTWLHMSSTGGTTPSF